MVTSNDVLLAADENLHETFRAVCRLGPASSELERSDGVLLASGLPVPIFNPAFVTAEPDDATRFVAELHAHYEAVGVPFALWFRDAVAPTLAAACQAAGLIEHWQPPLMVMDPIRPSPPSPDGLEIVVLDESTVRDYCDVLAAGFGMPVELARSAFSSSVLGIDGFTGLLALFEGVPVATSASFVAAGLAGVYNVATVPEHRGKGVGAAITWAAIEAGAATGATCSILQASSDGAPVYTRMGYDTPDRYRQFQPA
jgi:GNAT superfamily N-acetyltransferase